METGTIKTNLDLKKIKRRRLNLGQGFGNNGGGGNGGNNGGNNGGGFDSKKDEFEEINPPSGNKARILTAFLLLVVMMTFGGLLGAYIVVATNGEIEWKPFSLPIQIWISTAIILASSVTYHFALQAIIKDQQEKLKKWLVATTVLGAAFISSQILAWLILVREGIYLESNPYAGFFYILTAVHVVHVIGGIFALGAVVLRCWRRTFSSEELENRQNLGNVVGWYWHAMDGLWLVIFLLLGFWK